jgi:dihydroxy-acid dehydratase
VGGPIALLRDGDAIVIDAASHQINTLLKQDVLEARRKEWTAPPLKVRVHM